jgi:hypothetical protein
MAGDLRFPWYELLAVALALAYFGSFVAAVHHALGRLHFLSTF